MSVDIATLGIAIDSRQVTTATAALDNLSAAGGRTDSAFVAATRSIDAMLGPLRSVQGVVLALGAAMGGIKLADMARDAAQLAARIETLDVVLKAVGNSSGYLNAEMQAAAEGVRRMGITMAESRETVTKMAQSQLDLSRASELARVAQDAAVIGNVNSSEALGRLVNGIRSAEVETLRTIGINVSWEQSYERLAATLGKSAGSLSESEKAIARQNAVLDAGKNISGAYAGAMDTAGKMLSSTSRLIEDTSANIGKAFLPSYTDAVRTYYGALKYVNDAVDKMAHDGTLDALGAGIQSITKHSGEAAITLGILGTGRFLGPLVVDAAAAAVALDAAAVSSRVAAGAMTTFRATLAFLGGPVGIGISALGAAIYLLATHESEAEKIARSHAEALGAVKAGAEAAAGGIDRQTEAMVRQQRARAQIGANAADAAIAGIRSELGGAGMFGLAGDQLRFGVDVARQVYELKTALNAGRVDVEGFGAAIAEIAAQHPDFAGQAREVADLVTKYRQAEDAAGKLADQLRQLQGADESTVAAFSRGRLALQAFNDQFTNIAKGAGLALKDGKLIAQPMAEISGYEKSLADINRALAGTFEVNGKAVKFTGEQLAELAKLEPLVGQALQRLREKTDPLTQTIRNLGQEAAALSLPAGLERDRLKARQAIENATGAAPSDTRALDSAVSEVAVARLRDAAREAEQAAAGQRLLAAAAGGNALAQAEATRQVELYNQALRTYGRDVAQAVLEGKALPADLQALGRALEQADLVKFSGEMARLGRETQLEVDANGRLSAAWKDGSAAAIEAAQRENDLARMMERVPSHTREAAEAVDQLRASRSALAGDQFLGQLRQEIQVLEAVGVATRKGAAAAREAQAIEDANRVIRDPSAPISDPAAAASLRAQSVAKANVAAAYQAESRVLSQLHGQREQAMEDMQAIRRLYDAQAISAEQFAVANNRAMMRALESNRDFASGAELALRRYVDEATNTAAQTDHLFTNAFSSVEDQFINLSKTGEFSFRKLGSTVAEEIERMTIRAAVLAPIAQFLASVFGTGTGAGAGMNINLGGMGGMGGMGGGMAGLGGMGGLGGLMGILGSAGGGSGGMAGWLGGLFGGGGAAATDLLSVFADTGAYLEMGSSLLGMGEGMGGMMEIGMALLANGGVFSANNLTPFAKGSSFTNGVYDHPTLFQFANGSKFGVMGEAGPEAVMPLTRGPDGALGVAAHGGGGGVQVKVEVIDQRKAGTDDIEVATMMTKFGPIIRIIAKDEAEKRLNEFKTREMPATMRGEYGVYRTPIGR